MHPKKNRCITFWGGWKYRGLETNAMTLRHIHICKYIYIHIHIYTYDDDDDDTQQVAGAKEGEEGVLVGDSGPD